MPGISTFFTSYSARRGESRVEAIAVVILDGREPEHRYIVVDERGASYMVRPEELDLYGAYEENEESGEG
jgi:hypothetical protein